MRHIFIIILIIFFTAACQDKSQDKKIIMPYEKSEKNSKDKEYIEVFLNDDKIVTKNENGEGRLSLLLFGADGCSACIVMKDVISEKGEISSLVQKNYLPYFINITRKDKWNINGSEISLKALKEKFMIVGTPLTVIMYGDKILLTYPGYIAKNRLLGTFQFFLDKSLYSLDTNVISEKLKEFYKLKNI